MGSLAFFRSPQRCSIGFKYGKDTRTVVPKPLLHCLGCVLWFIVLLEGEPSAESELSLAGQPALERVLLVSNFKTYGDHCAVGNLQCRIFFVAFPRSVPQRKPISELRRQVLKPHGLVSVLICTVKCETLCRHPVQSV